MGGIGDRVRGFVRRGLWLGGMVHGMGKAARVRAVCAIPNYFGHGGFILGIAIGGIAGYAIHPRSLVALQTRTLKVFVVEGLPFGIIVLFGSSSRRDFASASPRRDTQPSPKS